MRSMPVPGRSGVLEGRRRMAPAHTPGFGWGCTDPRALECLVPGKPGRRPIANRDSEGK